MNSVTKYHLSRLRDAIQAKYTLIANDPASTPHFEKGHDYALSLGYDESMLNRYAAESVQSFTGVGMPLNIRPLNVGETVVDIGSGTGTDALLAAATVGSVGFVYGVEMTDAMLEKARQQALRARLRNIVFSRGMAERLPVPDSSADVVLSNGAITLCPDKDSVFREVFRILKPGGRIQIADVFVTRNSNMRPVLTDMYPDTSAVDLMRIHVAYAMSIGQCKKMLSGIGFKNIEITDLRDVFEMAGKANIANEYGALGGHIYAEKP